MIGKSYRAVRLTVTATCAVMALLLATGFISPASAASVAARHGTFESGLAAAQPSVATVADSGTAAFADATPHVRTSTSGETASTASSTRAATGGASTSKASSGNDLATARSILAGYIAKYPVLQGSTVTFGDAKGYQAVCYYRSARIVISPTHTASLQRIIAHEVGHIIDWRDNGVIDWGERIPAL